MVYVIIGIILVIALFMVKTYNSLVSQKEMVKNAMGQIAANIESRWDALSNLIEATKKYSDHEADVLMDITKSRSEVTSSDSVREVNKDDELFTRAMSQVRLVVENYPDLKASGVYQTTMTSVNDYENKVRMSRQIFNDTVTKYNRILKVFPNNLVAGMFGFTEEEYFKNTAGKESMPGWN